MVSTGTPSRSTKSGVVGGITDRPVYRAAQECGVETLRGLHRAQVAAVGGAGDDADGIDGS